MRIFWAAIALLILGTAGLIVVSATGTAAPSRPDASDVPHTPVEPASTPSTRSEPVGLEPPAGGSPDLEVLPLPVSLESSTQELTTASPPPAMSSTDLPGGPPPVAPTSDSPTPADAEPSQVQGDPSPVRVTNTPTTRSATMMLATIIQRAALDPSVDFVGRLADAGSWIPAPELAALVPDATRLFQVPVATGPLFVADDGSGHALTVIIPDPDAELIDQWVSQSGLLTAEPDAASVLPASRVFSVAQPGLGSRIGLLTMAPAVLPNGQPALTLALVRDASDPNVAEVLEAIPTTPAAGATPASAPPTLAVEPAAVEPAVEPGSAPAPDASPAGEPAAGDAAGQAVPPPAPTYTILDDGSIQLASGAIIRGQGTVEKPYELNWDLLVSAERVYQPRNGQTTLPDWCKALNLKQVRLTGHLLSPLMQDDTDQILLMRNQWDGCCIGVPPTPYDAVEITLSRPISLVREQLNYGTLTGLFEIDPYLVNNWLVGLYILSDAKVDAANAQNWAVPVAAPN